jgi:ribonucleoside-diphosphate reductase alpha chain
MAGIMDAFAKSISYGLQYGVPLRAFVGAFTNMRFEPAGMTDDPELRFASSIMDYLFRRLALEYLPYDERADLGIFSVSERTQPTLPGIDDADGPGDATRRDDAGRPAELTERSTVRRHDAPMCMQCGVTMVRSGSCHVCPDCGTTSGCS